MTNQTYQVIFNIKGVNNEFMKRLMEQEYVRVYDMYVEAVNNGITEELNNEFDRLYPNYVYKDKPWENVEYNQFMANGYQQRVVNKMNDTNISPLLNFYVSHDEVVFTGYLKWDRNATIDFYLKLA